jgi:sulfoxide reductase heme-binding subunit YedZ
MVDLDFKIQIRKSQAVMTKIGTLKIVVFPACLVPLGLLAWKGLHDGLGANPIEVITHSTGHWTLIFLLVTLGITPLRRLTGQLWLIHFRRMLGLFSFFYGCLHFTTYIWLDKFFDVHDMLKDIAKRPFITVGFAAFVLMIPLALTSTRKMIQRLGGRRWAMLHRLIYLSGIAAVVHYWWAVKKDVRLPQLAAGILALLLAYRVIAWLASRQNPPERQVKISELRIKNPEETVP